MQLLEIELVNSTPRVIARSVCAIHTISIHAKSNCITVQERRSM